MCSYLPRFSQQHCDPVQKQKWIGNCLDVCQANTRVSKAIHGSPHRHAGRQKVARHTWKFECHRPTIWTPTCIHCNYNDHRTYVYFEKPSYHMTTATGLHQLEAVAIPPRGNSCRLSYSLAPLHPHLHGLSSLIQSLRPIDSRCTIRFHYHTADVIRQSNHVASRTSFYLGIMWKKALYNVKELCIM